MDPPPLRTWPAARPAEGAREARALPAPSPPRAGMSSASSPRAEAPSHGAVHAQSTALVDENDVPIVPPWLRHYNRVISRKPVIPPSVGP